MTELLTYPFVQRALLAGLMVGVLASYFGVFVVQRGLSFLGSGLAHAAFGGVALGILLRHEPLAVAVPFTVLVALGITWFQRHSRLQPDTIIGVFFSVSMALGIIFLSWTDQYSTDAFTFLFGAILAVSWTDVAVTGVVMVASLGTLPLWGRWAFATFDRELAQADGLPCQRDDYALSVAIAVATVVSLKVVGITLVAAFLVIPAAGARLLANTFRTMTLLSMAIGATSVLAGMVLSYQADIPTGPAIILVQSAIFLAAMGLSRK